MLRHRDFSEYEVSSRRGASIFPLLLKQGCSEPSASPHPQKKGNDLICLNIVYLLDLSEDSSGFVRVYLCFPCSPGLSWFHQTLYLPLSIPCSDLIVCLFLFSCTLFVPLYHRSLGFPFVVACYFICREIHTGNYSRKHLPLVMLFVLLQCHKMPMQVAGYTRLVCLCLGSRQLNINCIFLNLFLLYRCNRPLLCLQGFTIRFHWFLHLMFSLLSFFSLF